MQMSLTIARITTRNANIYSDTGTAANSLEVQYVKCGIIIMNRNFTLVI
jgi:hypothetical protein